MPRKKKPEAETERDTRAVWARAAREGRRWLASVLLGWINRLTPARDTRTFEAIAALANAMLKDEG